MQLGTAPARKFEFVSPFSTQDLKDLQDYVETYPAQYATDIDDKSANQIREKLEGWGAKLYEAITASRESSRMFDQFLGSNGVGRKLTISANQVSVLGLPWEMLYVPGRDYLFNEEPSVSIRRSFAGGEGYGQAEFSPKSELRLLFVVSRPDDVGILDHRSEAKAVMDAIDDRNVSGISVEFLRPATLENLRKRLADRGLPAIDILHFDGHGSFSAGVGALCFEDERGRSALVDAKALGRVLNQRVPGLIVLSACKSSTVSGDDALGSIAVQLSQKGASSVIAMPYSVLAITTQLLFGEFYERLVSGMSVGESLDEARRRLILKTERGERVRNGSDRIELKLEDWFVPTSYQSGVDRGMVDPNRPPAPNSGGVEPLNMPVKPIAGFFGRQRELWAIEKAFTPNLSDRRKETRRMTIAGFGGQGKTALAAEAGRWLVRSGMFEGAVFVDYAAFQGVDAIGVAVSTIARDLEMNLIDGAAVTGALGRRRTLVILDNLEDLKPEVQQALLTQAIGWSAAGQSRVLITTRQDDLGHEEYGRSGFEHQLMALNGLGQEDAIEYFQGLMAVPPIPSKLPVRKALIELFGKVDFHPLSIALVAEQLRTRGIVDVDRALDRLLGEVPAGKGKDRCLIASLNLSLERLDAGARELVQRLGVFQGGAMERELLAITKFTPEQWVLLRHQLERAGLITSETLPNTGVPYLKFHPTLAPVLWTTMDSSSQQEIQQLYQKHYYFLSTCLYKVDTKIPHEVRAIARRELPNLLNAVQLSLDSADSNAVNFVNNICLFLDYFGMRRDRKYLADRADEIAGAAGSRSWYLSRSEAGEQLLSMGKVQQALEIFNEILNKFGDEISYERCLTLGRMGRCKRFLGQSSCAVGLYRQTLEDLKQLESSDETIRQICAILADLGDVLTDIGAYGDARSSCEGSLLIAQEIGEKRGEAIINFQFGTLALMEDKLQESLEYYQKALTQFQILEEPDGVASVWYQLGRVYETRMEWNPAQDSYRKSAEIEEAQGNLSGAAKSWSQLANVLKKTGKFQDSEAFYRKAIEMGKQVGEVLEVSNRLSNLAGLLQTQGDDRLSEARQLAEEALKIKKTIDSAAAQIWNTYTILATIVLQQEDHSTSRNNRRLSRQSYAAFAGSRYALQKFEELIQHGVSAITEAKSREWLEQEFLRMPPNWQPVATAIRQILAGVRDEDELCDELGFEEGAIIVEILSRL